MADVAARVDERWSLSPLARLHWQRWDDEWLVFDESSRQTFLISTLMAAALMHLEIKDSASAELSRALEQELGVSLGAEGLRQLEDGLMSLGELGLLKCRE